MKTETNFAPEATASTTGQALIGGIASAAVVLGLIAAFWPTAMYD